MLNVVCPRFGGVGMLESVVSETREECPHGDRQHHRFTLKRCVVAEGALDFAEAPAQGAQCIIRLREQKEGQPPSEPPQIRR